MIIKLISSLHPASYRSDLKIINLTQSLTASKTFFVSSQLLFVLLISSSSSIKPRVSDVIITSSLHHHLLLSQNLQIEVNVLHLPGVRLNRGLVKIDVFLNECFFILSVCLISILPIE